MATKKELFGSLKKAFDDATKAIEESGQAFKSMADAIGAFTEEFQHQAKKIQKPQPQWIKAMITEVKTHFDPIGGVQFDIGWISGSYNGEFKVSEKPACCTPKHLMAGPFAIKLHTSFEFFECPGCGQNVHIQHAAVGASAQFWTAEYWPETETFGLDFSKKKYVGTTSPVTHLNLETDADIEVLQKKLMHALEVPTEFLMGPPNGIQGGQKYAQELTTTWNAAAQPLMEEDLLAAAEAIKAAPAFGEPTKLYMNSKVYEDLKKTFFSEEEEDAEEDDNTIGPSGQMGMW